MSLRVRRAATLPFTDQSLYHGDDLCTEANGIGTSDSGDMAEFTFILWLKHVDPIDFAVG